MANSKIAITLDSLVLSRACCGATVICPATPLPLDGNL